jgi:hypothetical protein
VDQALVQRAKRSSIDPQPLSDSGPETFDCDVGGPCQRMDNLSSPFRFHVDSDASLVSVGTEKDGAKAGRRERGPTACFVTLPDGLYLDDFGTEIAEILGAQWTSQNFRQVEDAYAGQGFWHYFSFGR